MRSFLKNLKQLCFVAVLSLAASGAVSAAEIYVSGTGSDNISTNNGSMTKPFRTLGFVAGRVNVGDVVWIMTGTYSPFEITRGGVSESERITWKAFPGHTPELKSTGWNAIVVRANYQTIDGLTLTGNNDNVTLAQAEADYNKSIPTFFANNPVTKTADINPATGFAVTVDTPNPTFQDKYPGSGAFNGNGISGDISKGPSHFLTVRNCTIRKFGGGGLGNSSDSQIYENNLIYENAWYARYGNSGISNFPFNAPGAVAAPSTEKGYRTIIRGNKVWNNRGLVKWLHVKKYSDGNGIIIDVAETTYNGRLLISNNLVVNNGGSGIHAFKASYIDIVNNTAYQNGQKVGYADIFAQNGATDVKISNNVIYSRSNGKANDGYTGAGVVYSNNLYFNGTQPSKGTGDVVADPQFVNANLDVLVADFRLKGTAPKSPAIDTGVAVAGMTPVVDIDGVSRPQGTSIDKGAYEFSGLAINPTLTQFGVVGTAFTYAVTTSSTIAVSFSATDLPGGLSINASTGVISGTPSANGNFVANVTASNASGTATARLSFTISATAPTLPTGWASSIATNSNATVDLINGTEVSGSGTWRIVGHSNTLVGKADSFVAAWKPWTGNVTVTARLIGGSASQDMALAGITIRESAAANAKHASTLVSPVRGVVYSRRQAVGARTLSTAGAPQKTDVWIRLQRIVNGDGTNTIISSSSPDKVTWTEVRRDTKTTLIAAVQIGLIVSSASTSTLNDVTFSDVTITP